MKHSHYEATTIIDIVNGLAYQIKTLKKTISKQLKEVSHRELSRPNLHDLEVQHDAQKRHQAIRRARMSGQDLKVHLEKQYGKSNWSNKLIESFLADRTLVQDISWECA